MPSELKSFGRSENESRLGAKVKLTSRYTVPQQVTGYGGPKKDSCTTDMVISRPHYQHCGHTEQWTKPLVANWLVVLIV